MPGEEGTGTVVASGGGLQAQSLVGRRVACFATPDQDGTWAGFTATKASLCVPLLRRVSDEQGAMLIVNPLTAWSFVDLARRGGHSSFVQTAAGQLGRMIIRLAERRGVEVVNVVRRPGKSSSSKRSVRGMSSRPASRTSTSGCGSSRADSRRSSRTTRSVESSPAGSAHSPTAAAFVSSASSPRRTAPGGLDLIFRGQRVDRIWMEEWLPRQPFRYRMRAGFGVQRILKDVFPTNVRARFPLEGAREAVRSYERDMTAGKVLLYPWGPPAADEAAGRNGESPPRAR